MRPDTHKYLLGKGVKPSVQRIAVMSYLFDNRTHPTADEIFSALYPSMPTLSKTTVYNTLKLLVECGAALCIDIEGKNSRYDGYTHSHAHFMCKSCGAIYDLPLEEVEYVRPENIPGLEITEVSVYMKGHCAACSENKWETI